MNVQKSKTKTKTKTNKAKNETKSLLNGRLDSACHQAIQRRWAVLQCGRELVPRQLHRVSRWAAQWHHQTGEPKAAYYPYTCVYLCR